MRLTLEYIAGKAQTSGKGSISGKGSGIWKGIIYKLSGVATNLAPNSSVGVSPSGKAEKLRASWLAGTGSLYNLVLLFALWTRIPV